MTIPAGLPLVLIGVALLASQALAADPQAAVPPIAPPEAVLDIDVIATRLDQARQSIQPGLGASVYNFSPAALQAIPQGENAPLNQILLQAPGVAQDGFGQIHVRGDHGNLQYRLNGVQLPTALGLFGQFLTSRGAESVSLITGALPAQYGLQTAGVIDVQTKSGITNPGLAVSMYGGEQSWLQPSLEYGGRTGRVDYYLTGDYLANNVGIENPTNSRTANHDHTQQYNGLAVVNGILDENTRLSLIVGGYHGRFNISNTPGQIPGLGLVVNGQTDYNSAVLNQKQQESTQFAIGSLQKHTDAVDLQFSVFSLYSMLNYQPDPLGELLFNGIAQSAYRTITTTGAQLDSSWRVNENHTLRAGFLAQASRASVKTNSLVLPVDTMGVQTSDVPQDIGARGGKTAANYGIYLQDEWRLTDTVTLNYGMRFDAVDAFTQENQFSPRINIAWKATPTTTLHAGYARYFVPPPPQQVSNDTVRLFNGTTAQSQLQVNDRVQAERSNYFDAGISQIIRPGLVFGVDGYYKQATNLIDEGQFGAPIILTAFNYRRATVSGVETSLTYDSGSWSAYGNFAYSRAMGKQINSSQFIFSQDDLDYIAAHQIHLDHDQTFTASGGASYTLHSESGHATRFSVSGLLQSGLRTSPGTVPNGAALPLYTVVNLSVVQQLNSGIGRGTELRLDMLNIGDSSYQIRSGTGVGVGAPQYGLGRTILAGLTQRF